MNENINNLVNSVGKKVTLLDGLMHFEFLDEITKLEHIVRVVEENFENLSESARNEISEIMSK